jgi:hypothetical protein
LEAAPEADRRWRRCVAAFLFTFVGGLGFIYLFIVLIDPYDTIAFSLPIERKIVSISQRYMYPQIVRSRKFDSLIVGTSTSRLLDPDLLNKPFNARFANLAMNSMTAWEQKTMVEYFTRHAGTPKVLIVALDVVWCSAEADRVRVGPGGGADWLYDDNRWNDFLYLLNSATLEIAGRLVGHKLGLYPERIRFDGYEEFTPPESTYNAAKAFAYIWPDGRRRAATSGEEELQTASRNPDIRLPALVWLDAVLASLPPQTVKILAYMPVHIAVQPVPGTATATMERECKARIAEIGRTRNAKVIDWRIPSPVTREDTHYWDPLHYRVPIARQLAAELAAAALQGTPSETGNYKLTVP